VRRATRPAHGISRNVTLTLAGGGREKVCEALLWQTGYPTIRQVQERHLGQFLYTLGYPNVEVEIVLNEAFWPHMGPVAQAVVETRDPLLDAFEAGDMQGLQAVIHQLFASIPLDCIRAIDQGTTGSNVMLFDTAGHVVDRGYRAFPHAKAEATAWGVAAMAGVMQGCWRLDDLASLRLDITRFTPTMAELERSPLNANWQKAVSRTFAWESSL
jgi:hypothetical protein